MDSCRCHPKSPTATSRRRTRSSGWYARRRRSSTAGNPYRARIDVTAPPGHELVVRREPLDNEMHATLATVLIDAFKAMRRQLEALRERQRGEVKSHDEPRAPAP